MIALAWVQTAEAADVRPMKDHDAGRWHKVAMKLRSARQVTVELVNGTDLDLQLDSATLAHGVWANEDYRPPMLIPAGGHAEFRSDSSGFLTGVEGRVAYTIDDSPAVIHFRNPFVGKNTFDEVAPPGFEVLETGGGRRHRTVVHDFVGREGEPPRCDVDWVFDELRTAPNAPLYGFDEAIGFFTTPFKDGWGISGWVETGCRASGTATLVRDAQPSTDGYVTLDVAVGAMDVGSGAESPVGRFLRLEVPPGNAASAFAATHALHKDDVVEFSGPLRLDTDGPWLEVHPDTLERPP